MFVDSARPVASRGPRGRGGGGHRNDQRRQERETGIPMAAEGRGRCKEAGKKGHQTAGRNEARSRFILCIRRGGGEGERGVAEMWRPSGMRGDRECAARVRRGEAGGLWTAPYPLHLLLFPFKHAGRCACVSVCLDGPPPPSPPSRVSHVTTD